MTYKTADIVAFILDINMDTEPEKIDALLVERFPGVCGDQMKRALEAVVFELDERQREAKETFERDMRVNAQMRKMFEGLPAGITFGEAVRIKAAEGNEWAIAYLAFQETPERRTYSALVDAAYAAHPQFEQRGHAIHWLGSDEAPSETELLDWFQTNHPGQAREIERRYGLEGDAMPGRS